MKIKKFISLLTTAVIVTGVFAVNSFAYGNDNDSAYKSEGFTYALNEKVQYDSVNIPYSATVTEIPNNKRVEIPQKVTFNGIEYTVTNLELDGCYFVTTGSRTTEKNKYTNVEEIVLPETIYNIGYFSHFPNLAKMNLPQNVMIGRENDYDTLIYKKEGFYDLEHISYFNLCPKLKLSIDQNNPYYSYKNDMLLSKDGKEVYMSFNHSTDITIPDGVEKLNSFGGYGFYHVKNIKLPDTLKQLRIPLRGITKINLPNGLEEIGYEVFANSKITKITLNENLKKIGWKSFYGTKLTKIIIPDSVKEIRDKAFACSNIKSVKFGKKLTSIGHNAFRNCKYLKSVTIPENVKEIEGDAFRNCKKLKNVKILSNNVKHVSYNAFRDCKSLESVFIKGGVSINSTAFYNCKNLKTVTMNSILKINSTAFYNCKKLSKVIIKNKDSAPMIVSADIRGFKNTKKGIKFVVKNKKVANQLKKQLSKKKIKNNLKDAKIIVGKKVVYTINAKG